MGEPDPKPSEQLDRGDATGLNSFLAAFRGDRKAGCVRAKSDYQAQFPQYLEQIEAEFAAFDAGHDLPPEIPDVELEHLIGRGGQGVVYRGRQALLDRPVAVKMLSPSLVDPDSMSRFRREARSLAGLTHPNIVTCYHAGVTERGTCYLVMEFVPGPTLRQWLSQHGRLPAGIATAVARDLAHALAHAQATGIVHRDVKPENVLLQPVPGGPPGFAYRPKLADLGLARPLQPDRHKSLATPAGMVIGTPATMAPEQFDDPDLVDHRADIYGLGCVLYHALTGRPAFDERRLTDLLTSKGQDLGPDPRRLVPDLPEPLAQLVRRMLAKSPVQRPGTYDQLLAELDALLADPSLVGAGRRRSWRAAALVGLLALAVAGGYLWSTAAPREPTSPLPAKPAPAAAEAATRTEATGELPPFELFAKGEDPFASWTQDPTSGARDADTDVPYLHLLRGIATARRSIAFSAFSLQGKLEPTGRYEEQQDHLCAETGVRLEFTEGPSVQLDLRPRGTGYAATLRLVAPTAAGGWRNVDTIEEVEGVWSKTRPLPFLLRWGPDGLTYRLGEDATDGLLLAPATPPTALVLFVESGRTCFLDFELRGR